MRSIPARIGVVAVVVAGFEIARPLPGRPRCPPPSLGHQSPVSPTNGMAWRVSASTLIRRTAVFAVATSRT